MEALNTYRKIYFLGIGGIGMSALARYFHHRGFQVAGYDKTPSDLTAALAAEGMQVLYEDQPNQLPQWAQQPAPDLLVVRTPAIPSNAQLLQFFGSFPQGTVVKRSEVLGAIARTGQCLAVAGTHGKTTTSSLLTHLLVTAGWDPSAFLGGISVNLQSNLRIGNSSWMVVEADEFDRSFHTLYPAGAVITAVDPDHLDIYGTEAAFVAAFEQFAAQISGPRVVHRNTGLNGITYALEGPADYHLTHINAQGWEQTALLHHPNGSFEVAFHYPGLHNLENALGAAALCLELGMEPTAIQSALKTFRGVARRFEKIAETANHVIIDDYAHHPTELNAAIGAARAAFPGKTITGIFQPHLYSRTRDFMQGFAEALGTLDHCIVMPIYPARELPIPGITSEHLAALMPAGTVVLNKEAVLQRPAEQWEKGVILILGAGDIDRLVQPLKEILQ
jgi:UDP-N-acetylmuramate--alanine ligase